MEKNSRQQEDAVSFFTESCKQLGITLSDRQLQNFLIFYEYLIDQNKVMNLTAITDFSEVMEKHFVDSLSIVKGIDMKNIACMIDVGTGAGFPGLPLKIFESDDRETSVYGNYCRARESGRSRKK